MQCDKMTGYKMCLMQLQPRKLRYIMRWRGDEYAYFWIIKMQFL